MAVEAAEDKKAEDIVVLDVSEVAVVDEIAGAADLVMGKSTGIPAAIVRGIDWEPASGRATDLVRPASEDMFR